MNTGSSTPLCYAYRSSHFPAQGGTARQKGLSSDSFLVNTKIFTVLSFCIPEQQFLTQESMSSTFSELIAVIHIIATA